MTQEALAAIWDGNTFAQTLPFEQLQAYHVPFDDLTGEAAVENRLDYWSTRSGRVALVGESGTGKSSVMAAVLGALSPTVPDHLVPVRIPVELAEAEAVTEFGAFGRHLVHHILSAAASDTLGTREQEELENRLADLERRSGRRRRGGFSLGTGRLLPVDLSLSADLSGAGVDLDRQVRNGEVAVALTRLVALFRARGLEPFLIFDDTDAWLQLPGQEDEARRLATGFFANNVRTLSREVDCGFALAVHRSYLELPAYQVIADSLEHIELPVLADPRSAITAMIERRIEVDELGIDVADVFDEGALEALALIYSNAPDIRRVMAIAGTAARKAYDDEDVVIVTREAVLAARAERATFRGSE